MQRCKTPLSVLFVPLLAGAAAGTAVHAEPPARWLAPLQTSAQTRASTSGDQTESLRRPVTLDLVDAPLGSALEAITRQAGLTFAYSPTVLPAGRTVTLHASAMPAGDALTRVLDGTGLEPTMMPNGHLTLVRQPEPSLGGLETVRVQQAVVTGTVTDAGTGEPLRGAEVRIDESDITTVTDAEGRYTLEDVPPGTHTLVAIMIGYSEARETVTVTAGATASVDFSLTVSAVPLDEMVVTGTMVPTRMRAVPSPMSVLTADDIERRGVVRFEDILRSIPGIGVSNNSGTGYLSSVNVRGSSKPTGTNTIKTYINGVEVANPIYSLNQIDPASVDRIELIRGPQASTMYGAEAVSGVLQVFTKKGEIGAKRPRVHATLTAGGLQSQYKDELTPVQNHTVTISGGEQHLSYSLGASYRYTGEWVEDELIDELGWSVDNSVVEDLAISAGFRYVTGPFRVETSARTYGQSRGGPLEQPIVDATRSGRIEYANYTKPSGLEIDLDLQTYGATFNYDATPQWQHTLTLGYDATATEFRQPQPRLTTPADTFLQYVSLDWAKRSISYNTALHVGERTAMGATILAGINRSTFEQRTLSVQDARQLQGGLGNERANVIRGTIANYGYFAQSQVSWHDDVFLTAGIRADGSSGFGDNHGLAWSPRVGIAYTFGVGPITLKSRAAYGKAIRPPEPQQKLGQTIGNFVYLPADRLRPASQSGYDFGVEMYVGQQFSIVLTRYDQQAEHLIDLVRLSDPTAMPQTVQYRNVGRIKNTGWEIEGAARLDPLTVAAHYTAMESIVEELSPTYAGGELAVGEPPLDTPSSTAGFSVTYDSPRITTTLAGTYKGSWQQRRWLSYLEAVRGTDPEREPYTGNIRDYLDGYPAVWRFELNAEFTLAPRFTGVIMVDNLVNNSQPDSRDINLVRGRQVVLGVRFDSGG